MTQLWQTVFAIIGSIGGAGVIIAAIVKFTADIIADKLSKKYELKLSKELEKYKSTLDKKTYISRARFDMEFAIYGKLSESFLSMVDAVERLYPISWDFLPEDRKEREEFIHDKREKASISIATADKVLGSNAPFIPKDIYSSFRELRLLCVHQFNAYALLGRADEDFIFNIGEEGEERRKQRTREILEKKDNLIDQLREYLENLDVAEGI